MEFVVEDALVEIAGEADIEGERRAAHDVYAVAAALSGTHEGVGMLRLRRIVLGRFSSAQHDRVWGFWREKKGGVRHKRARVPNWNAYSDLVMLSGGGTVKDPPGGDEATLLPETSFGHVLHRSLESPGPNKPSPRRDLTPDSLRPSP